MVAEIGPDGAVNLARSEGRGGGRVVAERTGKEPDERCTAGAGGSVAECGGSSKRRRAGRLGSLKYG